MVVMAKLGSVKGGVVAATQRLRVPALPRSQDRQGKEHYIPCVAEYPKYRDVTLHLFMHA